jgi:hypothetical protein
MIIPYDSDYISTKSLSMNENQKYHGYIELGYERGCQTGEIKLGSWE